MQSKIEAEFPLINEMTYLNTAVSGLLPTSVLNFRRTHDEDFHRLGSLYKEHQFKYLAETREAVGTLFGCPAKQIALTPNFSFGMNTLLEGFVETTSFLLLQGDYPSVNWPIESRFANLSYTEINAHLEQNIQKAFETKQPDVFAFSIVQYITGIKINLEFIKRLKQDYPETIFIADATQFMGTEAFNFQNSGIDVLGASVYKWMNAGYGKGLMLFKENIPNLVSPKSIGFSSTFGPYKQQENSFIGKFEPGHQDTLSFRSLNAAIELINDFKMENIERRIEQLSAKAKLKLTEKGVLTTNVVERDIHSSIFNIRGDEALFETLKTNNIICIPRGEGIRVSFHYFNTEADLDALLQFL